MEVLATETILTPTLNSEEGTYSAIFYLMASNFPEIDFSGSTFTFSITVLGLYVDYLDFSYIDETLTTTVDSLMPDIFFLVGEPAWTQSLDFLTYRQTPDAALPLDSFTFDFSEASSSSIVTSQSG